MVLGSIGGKHIKIMPYISLICHKIKILLGLALCLTLMSCYIPGEFDATLEIDKEGRYRFKYYGDIMSMNMLRKFSEGDFKSQDIFDEAVALQLKDLTRRGGFKFAEHAYDATFRIDFEHVDTIHRQNFIFLNRQATIFTIKKQKDSQLVSITSHSIHRDHADELEKRGYKISSQFQLKTNATIISHNAETIQKLNDKASLLTWQITSLSAPTVKIELELEKQ